MSRPPPGKFLRPTRLTSAKRVNRGLFLCLSALLFLPLFLLRCILFTSPTRPQGATDLHYPSSLSEKRCHPCWELWPVSGRILMDPVRSVLGAVTVSGVQEPSGKPGWWACPRTYRETMLENSPCRLWWIPAKRVQQEFKFERVTLGLHSNVLQRRWHFLV